MNMKRFFAAAIVLLALVVRPPSVAASVTRIEILKVEPKQLPPGSKDAGAGPYEHIFGLIHGELDPNDPKNALITDIKLAPRNASGKVEYVAQFSMVKPVDMSKSTGILWYSVVNRGGSMAAASPEGHVMLVSGWQGDLMPTATNITIKVPVAKNPDGTSITGPFMLRFTDRQANPARNTIALRIPRDQPSPYPPVSLDSSKAKLLAITSETAEGVKAASTVIASSDWAFADCSTTPFPGKPDPSRVCVKNGFQPDTMYELQYTAKDPLVLGIGLAATRDINSFFRYESKDASGTANPVAGRIKWSISDGSSQSGTFLKLMLLLGFNQDEGGRKVWDGMNPHIAGRLTDLNRRFALPGGVTLLYELGHEAPTWWEDWNDTARGRGTSGLLDRCRQTNTCPKIMEDFGSSEIWGLRHSFSLVGTTAKADIPLPANVRRYYYSGVAHGGGPGGFSVNGTGVVAPGCELLANPSPSSPMYRALQHAFADWVTKDTPMPPSVYPSLADGTLVKPASGAMGFPKIPGKPMPDNLIHPLLDYDLGPDFNYRDQSGVASQNPVVKQVLPQLVPRVDADGNEVVGIKAPLQMAPLGSYLGWNVISSGMFKGRLCNNNGTTVAGYIPFARTKAERLASGDPRLSLEERYHTHAGYVTAVTDAANKLVKSRYLLQADADAMVEQAKKSDVLAERN
jgi:hypothetical protein